MERDDVAGLERGVRRETLRGNGERIGAGLRGRQVDERGRRVQTGDVRNGHLEGLAIGGLHGRIEGQIDGTAKPARRAHAEAGLILLIIEAVGGDGERKGKAIGALGLRHGTDIRLRAQVADVDCADLLLRIATVAPVMEGEGGKPDGHLHLGKVGQFDLDLGPFLRIAGKADLEFPVGGVDQDDFRTPRVVRYLTRPGGQPPELPGNLAVEIERPILECRRTIFDRDPHGLRIRQVAGPRRTLGNLLEGSDRRHPGSVDQMVRGRIRQIAGNDDRIRAQGHDWLFLCAIRNGRNQREEKQGGYRVRPQCCFHHFGPLSFWCHHPLRIVA